MTSGSLVGRFPLSPASRHSRLVFLAFVSEFRQCLPSDNVALFQQELIRLLSIINFLIQFEVSDAEQPATRNFEVVVSLLVFSGTSNFFGSTALNLLVLH